GADPIINRGAAGLRCHRERGSAVVLEGTEQCVERSGSTSRNIAADPAAAAVSVANQVKPLAARRTRKVGRRGAASVLGHDGIADAAATGHMHAAAQSWPGSSIC